MAMEQMTEKKKMYVHEFTVNFKGNQYTLNLWSEKSPSAFSQRDFEHSFRLASVLDSQGKRVTGYERNEILNELGNNRLVALRKEAEVQTSDFSIRDMGERRGTRRYEATDVGFRTPVKTVTVPVVKEAPRTPANKMIDVAPRTPLFSKKEMDQLIKELETALRTDPKFTDELAASLSNNKSFVRAMAKSVKEI
jgi:hypothetical protein